MYPNTDNGATRGMLPAPTASPLGEPEHQRGDDVRGNLIECALRSDVPNANVGAESSEVLR